MSDKEDASASADPLLQPFAEYWTSYLRQADGVTRTMLEGFGGSADPLAWRRQWLDAVSKSMDAYLRSPFFLQTLKAHIDALIETKRRADRVDAPQESRAPARVPAGTTPHDVVYEAGTLKLLRYRNEQSIDWVEPVLICFALVNRPYILDLQAERSVVRRLLERGFDVYLIDWGVPTVQNRALRLHDFICGLMNQVTEHVCAQTGAPRVNLLGYCMGGTMSTMFTALNQQRIRNLVLMAAPIDFGGDEGLLNLWARRDYFDVDGLIDAFGNCPGWFLQSCFQLMRPVQNFVEKYTNFCERANDDAFLDNFFAMERWASDSIPVAGETFREFVKMLYQQNQLVKGEMSLSDRPVRLDSITCPLLMLVAGNDHLVPPSSTLALQDHVRSRDVASMSIDAGHIGLAVSTKAHRRLWPEAASWIAERSTACDRSAATTTGPPKRSKERFGSTRPEK